MSSSDLKDTVEVEEPEEEDYRVVGATWEEMHSFNRRNPKEFQNLPGASEVLPNLFLGNIGIANDLKLLQKEGFTHVLNLTRHHIEADVREAMEYKHIKVKDNTRSSIDHVFEDAFAFIDDGLDQDGTVLVHCRAGVSRSTTVVLAYLIWKTKMSLHDAYHMVRSRRLVAHPNAGFLAQLQRFEMAVLGVKEPSLTYDDITHSVYERIIQLGLHDPLPDNDLLQVVEKACADRFVEIYGKENPDVSLDAGFSGSMGLHEVELYDKSMYEWLDDVLIDTIRSKIKARRY